MQLRYRLALPLAAICCLAFFVAPALAAKPAPVLVMQPDGAPPPVNDVNGASALCQMGIPGPPALVFGYILPPADAYYTLLNPQFCPTCHQDGYLLTNAHVLLYWTEPCQIPVTVSITPAVPDPTGCYTPNPFAPPLCAPVTYMLSDGGNIGVCLDFSLPISAACCITEPVFLTLTFDPGTCNPGRPAVCGPASCLNCTQYNYYPGANFPGDDLCAVLSPQGAFGINMYADAECCSPTPTLPGSWGMLKTLYR